LADVLALERRVRLPKILPSIQAATTLQQQGIPVILTGDFNSPSFHDWTPATVGTRKYLLYPVDWPVTAAVEAAGFRDSYRVVHPDPVASPGLTWPVHRPVAGWNPTPIDPHDRIDFIFADGAATPTSSEIVGEPGGPELSAIVSPFQSDHRLVVSTFTVTPGAMPTLISVPQRLIAAGGLVPVTYHAQGGDAAQVAMVSAGADPGAGAIAKQDIGAQASTDGTLNFTTAGWQPGAYEAALLDTSGAALSRFPFWVQTPGTLPSITTSKSSYAVAEPIEVSWQNAPADRWDWVGVYKRGADPNVAYYLVWTYTLSTVDGSATLNNAAQGKWPLPPGRYSAYLLKDDLYVKIAGADFSVHR
jgi:hypothetical protein